MPFQNIASTADREKEIPNDQVASTETNMTFQDFVAKWTDGERQNVDVSLEADTLFFLRYHGHCPTASNQLENMAQDYLSIPNVPNSLCTELAERVLQAANEQRLKEQQSRGLAVQFLFLIAIAIGAIYVVMHYLCAAYDLGLGD